MKRVGQLVAEHIAACREKYGCYPVPKKTKALKGKSKVVIPELPDYKAMKEHEYAALPLNREDERRRFRLHMPRHLRKMTPSDERRRQIYIKRAKQ